jgi:hypothetical protein
VNHQVNQVVYHQENHQMYQVVNLAMYLLCSLQDSLHLFPVVNLHCFR